MGPGNDEKEEAKGFGLMRLLHRQKPGMLAQMMDMSAVESRSAARRLNLKPSQGETYQDLGIVKVPEDMDLAVGRFAAKLSKAIYSMQMGSVFPANGTLMFHWFTNAQMQEHGRIPVLDAFSGLGYVTSPITRGGKDLTDQFDYKFSSSPDEPLRLVQAVFGKVFGFITIMSEEPGRLEGWQQRLQERTGVRGPFALVRSTTAKPETTNPGRQN